MSISVEARVWLATHLLYPNSTQAFDVYQAIVAQSEKAIRNNDRANLLLRLAQICEKIPAVNSSLSFHVFENRTIDEWRVIYKKTQRIQQLIFVGVLIFDLSLDEIAKTFKITRDKARFLFHQTFKKVVQQTSQDKTAYNFEFKKINDRSVTYLFTNESLIDFALGHLSEADNYKVKVGLENFPALNASLKIYDGIIKQVKALKADHAAFAIEIPKVEAFVSDDPQRQVLTSVKKVLNHHKAIAFTGIAASVLILVFIRPDWIENASTAAKKEAIVLLELKKANNADIELADNQPAMNLNELPIQSAATKQKEIADSQAKPVIAAPVTEPIKEPVPEPVKPVVIEKPAVAALPDKPVAPVGATTEAKKQGGLYRGTLVVTDLAEVTPKVIEKLVNLGGKKAGEVELGWRKTEKLGYYHFTIPQDNVEAVNEFLRQFGQYKIEFENHPRLVPAGLKRFIIEVKESE